MPQQRGRAWGIARGQWLKPQKLNTFRRLNIVNFRSHLRLKRTSTIRRVDFSTCQLKCFQSVLSVCVEPRVSCSACTVMLCVTVCSSAEQMIARVIARVIGCLVVRSAEVAFDTVMTFQHISTRESVSAVMKTKFADVLEQYDKQVCLVVYRHYHHHHCICH